MHQPSFFKQGYSTKVLRLSYIYLKYQQFRKNVKNQCLTAKIGGSKLRSMGFMIMKTCWFLCVSPVSSRKAALQKYCTHPCLPRKVEGRPRGRPSLNGKLWMPPDKSTGSAPEKHKIKIIISLMYVHKWCGTKELFKIKNFKGKSRADIESQGYYWK